MGLDRELKRSNKYLLEKQGDTYVLTPPPLRGLVLSGGGSKGIAYAGMIESISQNGQLKELSHVSGASAGAMTASLLALGIDSKNITALISQLKLTNLLDSNSLSIRAEGKRFRNVLELIYMQQVKEHLESITAPEDTKKTEHLNKIKLKMRLYQEALLKQNIQIKSFEDILSLAEDTEELKKLDSAFSALPEDMENKDGEEIESPRITFGDLKQLKELLPEEKKHLIKDLSVVVTNTHENALETYNADKTPNKSIAEMVLLSGAHPLLFKPGANKQGQLLADGGIIDNMPTEPLIDAGLSFENILCVKVESSDKVRARITKAQEPALVMSTTHEKRLDWLAKKLLGGEFLKGREKVSNEEKIFYHTDNMLFLNSGNIKTTTISPSESDKELAIQGAREHTKLLLDRRIKKFSNSFLLALYLGVGALENIMANKDIENEYLKAVGLAKGISLLQKKIVNDLNHEPFEFILENIAEIKRLSEYAYKQADEQDHKKEQASIATSLCLKQINFHSGGKFENFLTYCTTLTEYPEHRIKANEAIALLHKTSEQIFPDLSGKKKESNWSYLSFFRTGRQESEMDAMQSIALTFESSLNISRAEYQTIRESEKPNSTVELNDQLKSLASQLSEFKNFSPTSSLPSSNTATFYASKKATGELAATEFQQLACTSTDTISFTKFIQNEKNGKSSRQSQVLIETEINFDEDKKSKNLTITLPSLENWSDNKASSDKATIELAIKTASLWLHNNPRGPNANNPLYITGHGTQLKEAVYITVRMLCKKADLPCKDEFIYISNSNKKDMYNDSYFSKATGLQKQIIAEFTAALNEEARVLKLPLKERMMTYGKAENEAPIGTPSIK